MHGMENWDLGISFFKHSILVHIGSLRYRRNLFDIETRELDVVHIRWTWMVINKFPLSPEEKRSRHSLSAVIQEK